MFKRFKTRTGEIRYMCGNFYISSGGRTLQPMMIVMANPINMIKFGNRIPYLENILSKKIEMFQM